MPFKFHASRRHHIPRAKYRVMNWPDYDRGLVRRGDIRFWIDESALEQWDAAKRRTPGGQRRFSELAISTTLMLVVVFRLPLRQTEGFVRSLVDLMGCDLPVPDHTTLSRRRRTVDVVVETSTNKRSTDIVLDFTGLKFFGAGEWARAKHGETRRSWRKLHISVDPASSEIRTHELSGDDTADATMAGPLVAGSGGMIRRVFADGAYDGEPVTKAIREARPPNSPPEIIIPPRATSIPPPDTPHGGVLKPLRSNTGRSAALTRQRHVQDLHNAHGLVDERRRGAFGDSDNRWVSRKLQQETVRKQLFGKARLDTGGYVRNRVLVQIGDQFGPRYGVGQLAMMNGSPAVTGGRRQRIDRGPGRRADMQDIVKVEDRCLRGVGGLLHRQDGR